MCDFLAPLEVFSAHTHPHVAHPTPLPATFEREVFEREYAHLGKPANKKALREIKKVLRSGSIICSNINILPLHSLSFVSYELNI